MRKFIFIVLLVVFFGLLLGCKTKTVYVPIRSDSIVYRHNSDTLRFHQYDSIFIKQTGDTVFVSKFRDRILYRSKTDTITQFVTREIPIPIKETKKVVPRWCWFLLISISCYFIYRVFRWRYIRK